MGKNKDKHVVSWVSFLIVFLSVSGFLWHYLYISVGAVPLMDYWINRGEYIEKVMTQLPKLDMFITIPHALHWNPMGAVIDYFFVRLFGCDNRFYVYSGMLFSFCSLLYIMRIYKKYFLTNNILLDILGLVLCSMPVINLNQWEIFTLFCNCSFMLRIFSYYLIFGFIDRVLHDYNDDKKHLYVMLIFAISNIIIILFMSQAYLLGLIAAESGLVIMDAFIYRNKEKIKVYLIIEVSAFIGFVIYYITLKKGSAAISEGIVSLKELANYVQGVIIMIGSTVVPQTISLDDISICYEWGVVIFILAIVAVGLFFLMKIYEKTYFPLACLIYAFASITVIMLGRIDVFGLYSLTSSRYVVETTIGLLGLIQIYWYCFCKLSLMMRYRLPMLFVLLGIAALLCWTNTLELKNAPNRKAYNQTMEEMILNIDDVSDEELTIFQTEPNYVREAVAAMKKYHLLLWKE